MKAPSYEIRYVSRRTGLSPHRIRAWERRYQAIVPERSESGRRLYSESDVRRLQLLHRAIASGHRISRIGRLSQDDLLGLVHRQPEALSARAEAATVPEPSTEKDFIQTGLHAIRHFDAESLGCVLERAKIRFSRRRIIDGIVVPLMGEVGRAWAQGTLRIAHEHMASAVIQSFLSARPFDGEGEKGDAAIVIATPSGQFHSLGAMSVALTAAAAGWRTLYLGANLPAEEIAAAVMQNKAWAVAVSLVCTTNVERLTAECIRLRQLMDDNLPLYAGGQAPAWMIDTLNAKGIHWCDSLDAFHIALLSENLSSRRRRP